MVTQEVWQENKRAPLRAGFCGKPALPTLLGRGDYLAGPSGYWVGHSSGRLTVEFFLTGGRTARSGPRVIFCATSRPSSSSSLCSRRPGSPHPLTCPFPQAVSKKCLACLIFAHPAMSDRPDFCLPRCSGRLRMEERFAWKKKLQFFTIRAADGQKPRFFSASSATPSVNLGQRWPWQSQQSQQEGAKLAVLPSATRSVSEGLSPSLTLRVGVNHQRPVDSVLLAPLSVWHGRCRK